MTPEDIKSQRFSTRFLQGFSPEEVAAFLEDVAEAFDDVQKTSASLAARVKDLEDELRAAEARPTADTLGEPEAQAEAVGRAAQHQAAAASHIEVLRAAALQEVEALLRDARAQAQALIDGARQSEAATLRDAEAARARWHAEAEEAVAAATASADAIIAAAREQEATVREEIDRLAQSRLRLVDEIRGTLDTYHGWLTTVDPRGRARGRRDAHEARDGSADGLSVPDEARAV